MDCERTFSFYVPAHVAGNAPLVVALHGANSNGQNLRAFTGYEFDLLADKYGFVVAYPDSFSGSWNDCRVASNNPARRQGIDDVSFVKAVIGNLRTRYGAGGPVYVLGYSTGGLMVYRLAVEAPETFTAAAAISANLPTDGDSDCVPSQSACLHRDPERNRGPDQSLQWRKRDQFLDHEPGPRPVGRTERALFRELAGNASQPRIERLPDREGNPCDLGGAPHLVRWQSEHRTARDSRRRTHHLAVSGASAQNPGSHLRTRRCSRRSLALLYATGPRNLSGHQDDAVTGPQFLLFSTM